MPEKLISEGRSPAMANEHTQPLPQYAIDAAKDIALWLYGERSSCAELMFASKIAAHAPAAADPDGWILADETGKEFRVWDSGIPDWTDDPHKALRMCRRQDAEAIAAEDEDVWHIYKLSEIAPGSPSQPTERDNGVQASSIDNYCSSLRDKQVAELVKAAKEIQGWMFEDLERAEPGFAGIAAEAERLRTALLPFTRTE